MTRMMKLLQVTLLVAATSLAGCNDHLANAQTRTSTQQQIRDNLGDAPARIDTTTAFRLSAAFRGAAEAALPAVVRISVTTEPRVATNQRRGSPLDRIIPGFPGFDDMQPQQRGERGTGSGFVFDERGYIMTNNHVVENADRVLVTMVDGREYPATVVGTDPQTDVAVIKIDPDPGEKLTAAKLGSSDDLHVGDWVIALGNPLNLQFTVTAGIVSAKGRNLGILNDENNAGTGLESFIQTDAVINPGNSGGPMVDLTGKVVGINSAIESASGLWAGNGFAIPIDLAQKVASDIMEFGHVRRPRLGVEVGAITAADAQVYHLPSVAGAEVTSVQPGLAADKAGLQMGDVVVALNGSPIRTQAEFMEELARQRAGSRVTLGIIRYGKRIDKPVTLGEFETPATTRPASEPGRSPMQERLGFNVTPLTPQIARELETNIRSGVVVESVDRFSGAINSVFRGDIILQVNGHDIHTENDLERAAAGLKNGDVVSLVVRSPGRDYDRIVNYRLQ